MDNNLKAGLDIFDLAIKRLVVPVTMLVAAAVVSFGLKAPDSNHLLIYFFMLLLTFFAVGYGLCSAFEAGKAINELTISTINKFGLTLCFWLIYLMLFYSAIRLGLDKLSGL
ncbi:hypothetical protein [Shewanella dokdonensis]|uniref:Uncharacterized protein n=1 Tax=Shewanella dokdonensis TaxID=712036 RepID=A0ABX8DBK2_9GAMM|nr:hypothetical protein [Shewanella dokdonensis]MCL1074831.1 hypothetical protein [Shewanella dokdonensis]QVK22199.1 hypothetical protein KHX94_12235 [Shewanella dokdonensis]